MATEKQSQERNLAPTMDFQGIKGKQEKGLMGGPEIVRID